LTAAYLVDISPYAIIDKLINAGGGNHSDGKYNFRSRSYLFAAVKTIQAAHAGHNRYDQSERYLKPLALR